MAFLNYLFKGKLTSLKWSESLFAILTWHVIYQKRSYGHGSTGCTIYVVLTGCRKAEVDSPLGRFKNNHYQSKNSFPSLFLVAKTTHYFWIAVCKQSCRVVETVVVVVCVCVHAEGPSTSVVENIRSSTPMSCLPSFFQTSRIQGVSPELPKNILRNYFSSFLSLV